jgi:hypothetical protein
VRRFDKQDFSYRPGFPLFPYRCLHGRPLSKQLG